ncbi:2OG-Fe(II) oxygenase [Luteimonas sp. RD2P54]|uniref:2OG-Fe(II) oxygenase n=1 Tax=Luteimonas endophytica TaxID=3042023 RepID=A0ABT6JC58_9GAMM|nr:2OG-Fe(II) oxygenase [Luteimonas endophytica]MDH5824150.1 2OG-Fe(II) oxygenase [Luteimonas endophytica]
MQATQQVSDELEHWILEQVRGGQPPESVIAPLLRQGWEEQLAIDAVEAAMRRHLERHARDSGLPVPVPVPAPVEWNGAALLPAADREVQVLAHLVHPHVVVFGGLLSVEECDALVELARSRLSRSATVNLETGGDEMHRDRTSQGMFFRRGENALCARIEARIAALTGWPLENGEGLQVLRYGQGAEYRPHYDYFDPEKPGTRGILARGGQRVASLVMYLNTPRRGGATTFPDAHFEVAAVKGNAVFFSYDRPHPMTRSLHGGAPVAEGEKWVATKWLRERRYD